MDLKQYNSTIPYPSLYQHTVAYLYNAGQLVGTVRGSDCDTSAEFATKLAQLKANTQHTSYEQCVNKEAYAHSKSVYQQHTKELHTKFWDDLLVYNNLPDNEFTRRLISMAWEDGRSEGLQSVVNCMDDLAYLHFLAQKVYSGIKKD